MSIANQNEKNNTNSSLDLLAAYLRQDVSEHQKRSIPPLEKWHPENYGTMDLVIKSNGEWWHEGSKITRQSLVDLFASVLWREGSDEEPEYYLKTPVEKLRIIVEDVPFLINDVNLVDKEGHRVIEFTTSHGDLIELDPDHTLEMGEYQGEQRPYIPVRFGMKGLISRSVLMHLTNLGELTEREGKTTLTLISGGKEFKISVPS